MPDKNHLFLLFINYYIRIKQMKKLPQDRWLQI